ncbi:MAG: hypothetical protein EA380_00240 [Phycisphaeraceae bacterium]|nr:MAG: hypothetical protein EA380_00240 [Phycisphaeraceae bacterium]
MDRGVQARAVDAIATDCNEACIDELVALWERTDRFDVREHIMRAFMAMGDEGLHGIVRLARVSHPFKRDIGVSTLLLSGLSAYGEDAVEALVEEIEEGDIHLGHVLLQLIIRLDIDASGLVKRLIDSKKVTARVQAARVLYNLGVVGQLNIDEWSMGVVRLVTQSLASNRNQEVQVRGIVYLPFWSEENRAMMPEAFAKYLGSLRLWLYSRDMQFMNKVIVALNAHDGFQIEDLPLLRSISLDSTAPHWARVEAMKTYLQLAPDHQSALEEIMDLIDESLLVVCHALVVVDPDAFTDEMISAIVRALPAAEGRGYSAMAGPEHSAAADMIVATSSFDGRVRIGTRAMPALLEALADEDDELSKQSAWVLRRLGGEAAEAIPELIEQLGSDRGAIARSAYLRAMIAIASEDPRVREAVRSFISGELEDPQEVSGIGYALQELMTQFPEEAWVQQLVRPVMESAEHPLHGFVMRYPPAEYSEIILENEERLAKQIADTSLRDANWRYAIGEGDVEVDPMALHEEYERRMRAISALSRVERLSPEVVDALLSAIRSDVLEVEKPPGYGEYDTRDRRAVAKAALWGRERLATAWSAGLIAKALSRDPTRYKSVIDALREYPVALSFVLAASFSDEPGQRRELEVPSTLDSGLIEVMLDALLACRGVERGHSGETGWIVGALARLPTDDPRRTETLLEFVRFGSGWDAPASAMVGLGLTRPLTDEVLEEIRLGFDDLRWRVRHASYRAAAEAGEPGIALLKEFVARGEGTVNVEVPPDVEAIAEALRKGDHHVTRMLDEIGGVVWR